MSPARPPRTPRPNRMGLLLLGLLTLLLGASCRSGAPSPDGGAEHLVEVEMTSEQWEFKPETLRVKQGDVIVLRIESLDVVHGFGLPEFGVDRPTPPGKATTIRFVAEKPGTYTFFCTVFCGTGHPNHKGTLIVEPASP